MSRSATHSYWGLCCRWGEIGEDGFCDFHRPSRYWNKGRDKCLPPRKWKSRRGTEERRQRFPEWSPKSWHKGPPSWLKTIWWRKYRRRCDQDLKYGDYDNLQIFSQREITSVWDWY